MVGFHSGLPDLAWGHLANDWMMVYDEPHAWLCNGIPGRKIQQICWGPGIRTQVPLANALAPSPTELLCLIVNEINNDYYMEKTINMLEL